MAPRAPTPPSHRPRPRRAERGAALLVAIVAIAVLTALAVDLAYQTQVRLRIAASGRDQLRADALAQSGVTLSRLVLGFQAQLDGASQALGQGLQNAVNTGGQQSLAGGVSIPRIQIWNTVPVATSLTDALFPSETAGAAPAPPGEAGAGAVAARPEGAPLVAAAPLADFQGGFEAKIEDEAQKVNVQLDALGTSGVLGLQVEALLRLGCETRWDALFDRTDADGQRYSRTDLVINLRDWVDANSTTSALKVSFPAGNCSFQVPASPFEDGFGDENYPYDRGEDRYKTKNARMDSLDELHLVAGVTDAFVAAFGDRLTAYLPNGSAMNVNTDNPQQLYLVAAAMTDPSSRDQLRDPLVWKNLQKAYMLRRLGGYAAITPDDLKQVLQSVGLKPIATDVSSANKTNPFTDRSLVYKIRATGRANDVTRTIEAVVTFDPNQNKTFDTNGQVVQQPAQQGQLSTGRLIRWREE